MENLINSINKTDTNFAQKIENKSLFSEVSDLFTSERKKIFLKNISDRKLVDIEYYYRNWIDCNEDFFQEITYHKDIGLFIDDVVNHLSWWRYMFLNSYDEDSSYSPTDPDYRFFDTYTALRKNQSLSFIWWKSNIDLINGYMDHLRNWDIDKADSLNIDYMFIIDHKYAENTLKEIMTKFLLELSIKDRNFFERVKDLFYTQDEVIKKEIEKFTDQFNEEELENLEYEDYLHFYENVFWKINRNIIVDIMNQWDLTIHIPTTINWIEVDAKINFEHEFFSKEGAFECVKDILKQEKALSWVVNIEKELGNYIIADLEKIICVSEKIENSISWIINSIEGDTFYKWNFDFNWNNICVSFLRHPRRFSVKIWNKEFGDIWLNEIRKELIKLISRDDVKSVAKQLNVEIEDKDVQNVLDNYLDALEKDSESTRNVVVERMLNNEI